MQKKDGQKKSAETAKKMKTMQRDSDGIRKQDTRTESSQFCCKAKPSLSLTLHFFLLSGVVKVVLFFSFFLPVRARSSPLLALEKEIPLTLCVSSAACDVSDPSSSSVSSSTASSKLRKDAKPFSSPSKLRAGAQPFVPSGHSSTSASSHTHVSSTPSIPHVLQLLHSFRNCSYRPPSWVDSPVSPSSSFSFPSCWCFFSSVPDIVELGPARFCCCLHQSASTRWHRNSHRSDFLPPLQQFLLRI